MTRADTECSIDDCPKPATGGRGWCPMHWRRWRRHGDPLTIVQPHGTTLDERLWDRLILDGDCWLWTGAHNKEGYGRIFHEGALTYTHRLAYEVLVGPIPDSLELDHLCRRPACCNPYHLEPVTKGINRSRGNRDAARERREEAAA